MDSKHILVVDDQELWLKTIQVILGDHYDLSLAHDPEQALELAQNSFYSLAILDQRITPDVTGLDLLKRLRDVQPDLRCIILTGYADLDDAVRSLHGGAGDYLSKGRPDLEQELRKRVAKIFEEQSQEEALLSLIRTGENAEVEFKSSARWDTRLKRVNKELELVIVRTVAGFLNSQPGGTLLIGVDDMGEAKGLRDDYKTLKKKDKDGFENFFVTLLTSACGKEFSPLLRIDFPRIRGVEICRVSAKPSSKPVYVPGSSGARDLYIRAGNSTRKLNTAEAIEYSRVRWNW